MFTQMLAVHWKRAKLAVLVCVFVAFALPILAVQSWSDPTVAEFIIQEQLALLQRWGVAFPVLAGAIGLILAVTAWSSDHRGNHVYALSLPLPRWYYVLLKLAAGMVLLAPPVAAFWVASMAAVGATPVPAGLETYASALGLRFALATLVAFAFFFAITAGTNKTAGYVLGGVGVVVSALLLTITAGADPAIVERVVDFLFAWPSPFEIFGGRWMLIDV